MLPSGGHNEDIFLLAPTFSSLQQGFNGAVHGGAPCCSLRWRHQQQCVQQQYVFQLALAHRPLLQLQGHSLPLRLQLTHTHTNTQSSARPLIGPPPGPRPCGTLLSARLVMLALAARWATRAASSAAAAASCDWVHALRTSCHQGETD